MDRPRLSASQLNTLSICGLRWYYRYVKGIKRPPGSAAVRGKGGHVAVEADMQEKLITGQLLPVEAVRERARDGVDQMWREDEPQLTEDEKEEGKKAVLGRLVDETVEMVTVYHKAIAPGVDPLALEEGFLLEVPGFPYDVVGYVDIREATRIRDTKFKSRKMQEGSQARSTQLALYDLAAKARGRPVNEMQLDVLAKGRYWSEKWQRWQSGPASFQQLAWTPGENDHREVLLRMETAAKQIERGIFPPADPTSWACSANWCGYYDGICPHGSRKAVSLQVIDPNRLRTRPIDQAEQKAAAADDGWDLFGD